MAMTVERSNPRVNSAGRVARYALAALVLPSALAQTVPVFRATSETVLVPTTVLDKQGQPLTGLKLEDFALRVDGRPVKITALNEISGPLLASAKVKPLPPGTVTNVMPLEATQRSWVILLVDLLNTSLPDRMELRRQLLKFLTTDLRPGQPIAIYALGNSLTLVHPFTSDTQQLIEAAQRLMNQKGLPPAAGAGFVSATPVAVAGVIAAAPGAPATIAPANYASGVGGAEERAAAGAGDIESFLLAAQWRMANYNNHTRAEDTLAQFRQLANAFAGVAGKKTVLWLTGDASPLNPTLMNQVNIGDPSSEPLRVQWPRVAATYEAMSAAGISLFPVDIRGVGNSGLKKPDETPSHPEFVQTAAQSQPSDSTVYSSATAQRQGEAANAIMAMETAAVETGGRVLAGSNDLSGLLGRAQSLWSSYYVLAFAPQPEPQGKSPVYHRIEVKVPGRAVEVLYRRGYSARPESLIASDDELKRDVGEASNSPVDLTAIPLTLKLAPEDKGPSSRSPRFMLIVPASALDRSDTPQGSRYYFSIFILLKDARGKVLSDLGDKIDKVFAPAEAEALAKRGFAYPGQFDAPAGEKTFGRIIVRDNLSGRVGTITVQIGKD
jgi:VWFA-related protein